MIQVGDRIPDATLFESTEMGEFCPISPGKVSAAEATKGKKIVIFGLPGAYTPTCSAKHVPGYLAKIGKIRFLGDGSAEFAKKLGLENDLTSSGMGMRMRRSSLLVDDGVVKAVNVEQPGKFEVSNAETMLTQLA